MPITQADVTGVNGVIQAIQNVLIPPTGSLFQTLQNISTADTTYSQFIAALNWASTGSTNLDTLLSGGGIFTVFLPNNNAFRNYFGDTLNVSFSDFTPDSIAAILKYHILQTRQFSPDFAQVAGYPTLLNGDSIYFFNSGAYLGKTDSTGTGFSTRNIMANNGVIHKINAVLTH
ncbi:MAG: fasciclin domain-containing protein [Bacteroidetes bacterium]|nr:fasciclin domain-containing protein [Bacteroidota bacterium]